MSVWWWVKPYARWREEYLTEHPEKRLFPWIFGGIESGLPEVPIVTVTPEATEVLEKIKNKGILVLVILALVLASSSD